MRSGEDLAMQQRVYNHEILCPKKINVYLDEEKGLPFCLCCLSKAGLVRKEEGRKIETTKVEVKREKNKTFKDAILNMLKMAY